MLRLLIIGLISLCCSSLANAITYKIHGVDGDIEDNVEVYLESQNFTKETASRRVLRASESQVIEALRAMGYYQSEVSLSVDEEKSRYTIDIDLGSPVMIKSFVLDLQGEASQDPLYLQVIANSPIKQDEPFRHDAYEALKSNFNRLAARYGYFDANYGQAEVRVSLEENTADILLEYNSGIRYSFGDVKFSNPDIPQPLFETLHTFDNGDYYDAEQIGKYNQKLGETDYFQLISVVPDLANRHEQQVDVLVDLKHKHKDIFEVGGGITTDVGVRGRFKWNRPWVNQKGHSTGFEADLSQAKQSGSFFYRIPMNDPVDDYLDLQLGSIREDTNDTYSEKYVFSMTRQWRLDEDWKAAIFVRLENEKFQQAEQLSNTNLVLPGVNMSRLRARGGLDPHWGDNVQASLEVADPIWGSDVQLVRLSAIAKWLRSYGDHRLLMRTDLGAIYADSIYDVPASMRFFAGGDQSIRGYDYKVIAPEDDNGLLIGGKYLTVASLEHNYQFAESWRWATFIDAGTATNDFSEPVSVGVGMGLRWVTMIGPLRIDFAYGLNNEDDPWRIHFSMGPDL